MAQAASLAWPPLLLLSLLSLSRAPSGAGTETIGVLAPAQVRGFLGDTTELPCKLQPLGHNVTVTQVTWTRQKLAEASRSVAVFHPTQGPSFPEPGRLEFVAARPGEELRDASLAVRGLRAEDEGNYTCQFATFPNGDRSARTWLRVLDPPEVSISGYDGNWYIGRSEASLHCDVRSKPEPTGYDWNTIMGPLPPSVVAQGAQLLIHTVDESINTTFICLVTNALGTGQAEVTVLVIGLPREPSHSGLSSEIIIILTFTIILVGLLLLGLLIYFRKSRNFRWNLRSSSANGNVIYSAVGCNASSPQDPPTEGTR
nr:poliovirus receptor homolog isoform X2 [Globicephala melas]